MQLAKFLPIKTLTHLSKFCANTLYYILTYVEKFEYLFLTNLGLVYLEENW